VENLAPQALYDSEAFVFLLSVHRSRIIQVRGQVAMPQDTFARLRGDIKRGDVIAVRAFLASGGDPNIRNEYGGNPLSDAAFVGQTPIVDLLLSAGADVNSQNRHGHTPLFLASLRGHERTVRVLLGHGADPSIPSGGFSIVGWLSNYGASRRRIVELLATWNSEKPGAV
jgi:ankyrin repeat protein